MCGRFTYRLTWPELRAGGRLIFRVRVGEEAPRAIKMVTPYAISVS
jgi:hypothetical protein